MGLKDIFSDPSKFKFYGGKGYPTPSSTVGGVGGKLPLLTLNYGNDRPGGGSSSQPFVQQSIPEGQIPFQSTTAGGIDNIINNAQINTSAVGQDLERIGKWFTTTPGVIFIGKQNVLSQTNVRTQANNAETPRILINGGPYTPTNTLAQVAGVNFGSHFYKQGLTPGGLRVPKYGDRDTIIYIRGSENGGTGNRLVELTKDKIINYYNTGNDNTNILTYPGGPGAFLGVGSTNIQFANKGGSASRVNLYKNTNLNQYNYLVSTFKGLYYLSDGRNNTSTDSTSVSAPRDPAVNNIRSAYGYTPLAQEDFRKTLINNLTGVVGANGVKNSSIISDSPDYITENIEQRVFLGNPGTRGNIISYTKGKSIPGIGYAGALDKITAKPLYSSILVANNEVNDLVKFRIEAINNDLPAEGVFMHFRAFLDTFSDNYNADWSSTQYVGRGEKFYNYNSFDRTINLGWTVAAQSKEELIPMYQKLNFLASNLMPDYNKQGYMRGPLVRMTVGGYLYSQPGFLTSLVYDVPQESPWEIGINDEGASDNTVKELPHMMKVTATFTPIHTFVPRKQVNTYGGTGVATGRADNEGNPIYGDEISSFGPERYIALSTGDNNNYDN